MKALVLALGLLAAGRAPAEELPAASAPAARSVEVDLGGLITDGDGRRMRELTRTPTALWGTARLFLPLESPWLWGQLRLEASSNGTGSLWLDGYLPDRSHLVVRASRYRFPYGSVARGPGPPPAEDAAALDRLEQSREQIEVAWDRALGPLGGRLDVAADFQRLAGSQPLLAAGFASASPLVYAFGNPAYRQADDLTGGARAGYSAVPGAVRLRLAGGVRFDRIDNRLLVRDASGGLATGLADLHDTARSRTLELVASAASDQPAPLVAGGSYRVTHTATAPHVDHRAEQTGGTNGTIRSDDADVRVLRQHGAAGLAWQPIPRLRLAGRLDARLTDLDAHASQTRDLGTLEIVRANATRDNWSLDGRLQGRYGLPAAGALELDARGGLRRGEDDWSLRYLLADGATSAGERARDLDRHLLSGRVELRLVARLPPQIRATVGAHLEGLRSDESPTRLVDAFQLGNRSRTRAGGFVAARTRLARRLVLDGRASLLRDTWASAAGGRDRNWRFDVRLRATGTAGPLMIFALGSLTEDRHDLTGGEAQPGFASLDFIGRSWVALAGATATLGRSGFATVTYTLVANTADLTTRLQDGAFTAGRRLYWQALRLELGARYLAFRDRTPAAGEGHAALLLLRLAGSF